VEESLASQTQVKSSVARGIKKKILDQYPMMEATIDGMMTKKATTVVCQMCVLAPRQPADVPARQLTGHRSLFAPAVPPPPPRALPHTHTHTRARARTAPRRSHRAAPLAPRRAARRKETKTQIVVVDTEPIFFSVRDGPMMPTLRVLHKCACAAGGCR